MGTQIYTQTACLVQKVIRKKLERDNMLYISNLSLFISTCSTNQQSLASPPSCISTKIEQDFCSTYFFMFWRLFFTMKKIGNAQSTYYVSIRKARWFHDILCYASPHKSALERSGQEMDCQRVEEKEKEKGRFGRKKNRRKFRKSAQQFFGTLCPRHTEEGRGYEIIE